MRALIDLYLRKTPNKKSPDYEEWIVIKAGTVFEPPAHMDVKKALKRGIVEEEGEDA